MPEADDDDAILFGFDRLVYVPARGEVRQEIGHPRYCVRSCVKVKGKGGGSALTRTDTCHAQPELQ